MATIVTADVATRILKTAERLKEDVRAEVLMQTCWLVNVALGGDDDDNWRGFIDVFNAKDLEPAPYQEALAEAFNKYLKSAFSVDNDWQAYIPWLMNQLAKLPRTDLFEQKSVILLDKFMHETPDDIKEGTPTLWALIREKLKQSGSKDVNSLKLSDLVEEIKTWKKRPLQGEVVYRFSNGWTLQKLTTKNQMKEEGEILNHCVGTGTYYQKYRDGKCEVYSLRDANKTPHATAEWRLKEDVDNHNAGYFPSIAQFYGRNNAKWKDWTDETAKKMAQEAVHVYFKDDENGRKIVGLPPLPPTAEKIAEWMETPDGRHKLANMPDLPVELAVKLARDESPATRDSVATHSKAEEVLNIIAAEDKNKGVLVHLAKRSNLPESVALALVERGIEDVVVQLSENDTLSYNVYRKVFLYEGEGEKLVKEILAGNLSIPYDVAMGLSKSEEPYVIRRLSESTRYPDVINSIAENGDLSCLAKLAANINITPEAAAKIVKIDETRVLCRLAENENIPPAVQIELASKSDEQVRKYLAENKEIALKAALLLARDSDEGVRYSLAGNNHISKEVIDILADDEDVYVVTQIASRHDLSGACFLKLAGHSDLGVRVELASNSRITSFAALKLAEKEGAGPVMDTLKENKSDAARNAVDYWMLRELGEAGAAVLMEAMAERIEAAPKKLPRFEWYVWSNDEQKLLSGFDGPDEAVEDALKLCRKVGKIVVKVVSDNYLREKKIDAFNDAVWHKGAPRTDSPDEQYLSIMR
jgi:hypothetical protein